MVFRGSGLPGVLLHKLLGVRIDGGRSWFCASASDNVKDMERELLENMYYSY